MDGVREYESPVHAPRFLYRLGTHGTVWGFGLIKYCEIFLFRPTEREREEVGDWHNGHSPLLELDTVQSLSGHPLIFLVKVQYECALLINLFAMAQITLSTPT